MQFRQYTPDELDQIGPIQRSLGLWEEVHDGETVYGARFQVPAPTYQDSFNAQGISGTPFIVYLTQRQIADMHSARSNRCDRIFLGNAALAIEAKKQRDLGMLAPA